MSNLQKTTDYGQFDVIEGNRDINPAHVKRLMKVLVDNNLIEKFPIVVNSKMQVIDGQHRLEALKRLELPVWYRVEDNVNIEDIRILNQTVQKWTWLDLAKSYVELGNENYQLFIDLAESRPSLLNLNTLLMLANINRAKTNTFPRPNYFYGGGLEMSDEQVADLKKKASWLCDFADAQPHLSQTRGGGKEVPMQYVVALSRIMNSENYNHRTFIQRISADHAQLPNQVVDMNEALRELEKAYNHKLSEGNRVRLF